MPAHNPICVTAEVDREEVARLITKYDLLSVPVVDADEQIIGIVTFDDVIDAMIAETTEDACRSSAAWRRWTSPITRSASSR